ncbi:metallophosphoesterase [Oceanobacillus halophilus]|uniref:Metallophosphoesterase n=1 Tax=Oceanobacillus halophilus TaxID=930130 RepID=A0A495ACH9_9BACI|nr:metallophosphoesterase [Oceanobacillus halophilus]RKQ37687.1 metallophosphoesterase [Oceanobacillus halophilus]
MKKNILFFVFAFPILFFYMIYKAHHDKIKHHTILDENIPSSFEGFRIFFISDIHRRRIKETTLRSITKDIDCVIIGGDLTEKNVPLKRIRSNLQELNKWNVPIYFVWGNNDYETNFEELYTLLDQENVIVLANSSKNIKRDDAVISFLGLDCSTYKEARLDLALRDAKGDYFILLTHMPSGYYDLEQKERDKLNVVLAGHTHGGQIRIVGFGPYERGTFKKVGKTSILISEGYGYTLLPFRLGTDAECHVISLSKDRL